MKPEYIGIDLSTQQAKLVLCDGHLRLLAECSVQFEVDLPGYKTVGGVHKNGERVTSPVKMWLQAIDMSFERARRQIGAELDFAHVKAISGCAQQHGSVYWTEGAAEKLTNLDHDRTLLENLKGNYSSKYGTSILHQLQQLARVTGSRAYHRFTGPQIMHIGATQHKRFLNTERISLVSSFACSLFLGRYAPMDYSDASGTNLFDIHAKTWNPELLKCVLAHCQDDCGECGLDVHRLQAMLGEPVSPVTDLGPICDYFVRRHGFSPLCRVVVFTGDNPSAICGMALGEGDALVSWGTSDTLLCAGVPLQPLGTGGDGNYELINVHLMCDPLGADNAVMAMLCFKNGAFTRERVRKSLCSCEKWNEFDQLLHDSPPGNNGKMAFYYDFAEILPNVGPGDWRFDENDKNVSEQSFDSSAAEARAVFEHQCLAKWTHAMRVGMHQPKRLLVTGGAASNLSLQHTLADVFGAPVFAQPASGNAAALGAAYRAKFALREDKSVTFNNMCSTAVHYELIAEPRPILRATYDRMAQRYVQLEQRIVQGSQVV